MQVYFAFLLINFISAAVILLLSSAFTPDILFPFSLQLLIFNINGKENDMKKLAIKFNETATDNGKMAYARTELEMTT
jgi:hypothetical protein